MTIDRLDYPPEKLQQFGRDHITMEANTEPERSFRINACAKEPWTVDLIESMQPGEVLWDIGACVGSYTLLAAARGLMVVAFEPVSENYATLCRNLALNDMLDKVMAFPFALGAGAGMLWMHRGDMRSGAASHLLTTDYHKMTLHRQLTPVFQTDSLMAYLRLPPPHAIKLDVDGTEPQVLEGMQDLLKTEPLRALLIELHNQWDGALTVWLGERGWVPVQEYEQRGPIRYSLFGRQS